MLPLQAQFIAKELNSQEKTMKGNSKFVFIALGLIAAAAFFPALTRTAAAEDAAIAKIDEMIQKAGVDKSNTRWKTSLRKPEAVEFDSSKKYYALMKTNKGDVKIKFMPKVAPMHVTNFIYLARMGFYDGLKFHRVIPGFMAQGGCPLGTGTGGPGYTFFGEFDPNVKHDRAGLLSTANLGRPGTDGSQFFLTFAATPWLDPEPGKPATYTIYGEITEGLDTTLRALEKAGTRGGRPTEELLIEKVTIEVE